MALYAKFYVSLFTFSCVIIPSTHYVKFSSITTVFSPKGLRYTESLHGSQVLFPGLWILKPSPGVPVLGPRSWALGFWGPESWVPGSWVPILGYANITKFLKEKLFIENLRWLLLYFFKSN